jgi:hypothetical protein
MKKMLLMLALAAMVFTLSACKVETYDGEIIDMVQEQTPFREEPFYYSTVTTPNGETKIFFNFDTRYQVGDVIPMIQVTYDNGIINYMTQKQFFEMSKMYLELK